MRGAFVAVILLWVLGVLASLGVTAFVIWAIYRLVVHFTGG